MSLKSLKQESREHYDSIVSVECPILGGTVFFRRSGYFHLINESNSTHYKTVARNISEQYLKLKCLPYAVEVLKNCEKVSEVRTVKRKNKDKWQKLKQHELVCEVSKGIKVRVIVDENNLGVFSFASIMPHDNASKRRMVEKSRKSKNAYKAS